LPTLKYKVVMRHTALLEVVSSLVYYVFSCEIVLAHLSAPVRLVWQYWAFPDVISHLTGALLFVQPIMYELLLSQP